MSGEKGEGRGGEEWGDGGVRKRLTVPAWWQATAVLSCLEQNNDG